MLELWRSMNGDRFYWLGALFLLFVLLSKLSG